MAQENAAQTFIERWQGVTGSERANYQLFVTELCRLLAVPEPEPARDDTRDNAYVFERRVTFAHGDGSTSAAPLALPDLDARFTARGRWRERLPVILDTLEALGRARPPGGLGRATGARGSDLVVGRVPPAGLSLQPSHGLITFAPAAPKGPVSRVATAKPLATAMAAM
jgi:hypothetical protein